MIDFCLKNWDAILGFVSLIGVMWGLITRQTKQLHEDFKELKEDNRRAFSRMDSHAQRIDQLYQMFITLVKEGKK